MKLQFNVLLVVLFLLLSQLATAQKGGIRGTVLDKGTGEPLIGAVIYLDGTTYASSTTIDGDYNITGVPVGDYILKGTFLGYDSIAIEVSIGSKMVNQNLLMEEVSTDVIDIVQVDADKTARQNDVAVSLVRITPKEINRIPAAGGEADFAQYLQVLPGIVSTGDQGGQLYIRGGAPVQNRILLDGMTLFNAFHSIGFFSVFETDIIRSADVYTGGFSAKYGGRSSAVVDIKTREGNKTRFAGMLNVNPFVAKGIFEGPIVKLSEETGSSISFLMTVKHSYLRETSPFLYSYANEGGVLPYNFTDGHAKISFNTNNGSRVNVFGFYHSDNVRFDGLAAYDWDAAGGGVDFRIVPGGAQLALNGTIAYSIYGSEFNELGATSKVRRSDVGSFNANLNVSYYLPKSRVFNFGVEINSLSTSFEYSLGNNTAITQGDKNAPQTNIEAAVYGHFQGRFGPVVIEPSVRMQAYASLGEVKIEPRLGLKWNITDYLRFKAAGGFYTQNLISSVDERDVVNLFVGFLGAPDDNVYRLSVTENGDRVYEKMKSRLQTSIHAIAGFELDLGKYLTLNLEPYYKYFPQIVSLNRNRAAGDIGKNFLAETGDAYGIDFSGTYDKDQLYLYASYSLGYVTRNDGVQSFFAHFDRRHNVNFVGAYQFRIGKKKPASDDDKIQKRTEYPFEIGIRWNLGSGFPFTRTQGFYANQSFIDGIGTNYLTDNTNPNTTLGVVYEEEINQGRLPFYHRLDISIKYTLDLIKHMKLTLGVSVTNVYNRENIFYFDRIEYKRINQLPIMPALNINLKF
ncbi:MULTISPECIES: carboxypeptidase-like regulatory domain-containing protein [unclassified Aureispira]|uniref:TonB-dependent receptor n=1 Tax=unclassified Aureispira TaxID=2649989 RepID=UPI000696D14B|nr:MULTISPECIES: carboxypeptidase-like regulatory domain-containing protein [unclassified Aureispira]WMX15820.1 carboxypeptidase-like regulatory domain-containing protein [Aureispira sp. CCB-E]